MRADSAERFAIYSRKSKITGVGESIENQIELCLRYIALHYGEDAAANAAVYEDEGFSGSTLERPRFKEMMTDVQKKQYTAIVVYRLDRISRNIGDFAKLIEDLNDRGIAFISIREQFDTSSPMGRAMMYIASVFSQLERETIAERIRDNMHELAKSGRWLGGTTPTGYASVSRSYITLDGKNRRVCYLKSIPEEIRLVRRIFETFLETGSLHATEQFLHQEECRTKRGKNFTRFAVKAILSNPVYMIADEEAYRFWVSKKATPFAERSAFDGVHGIMTYNRTLQRPGQTHKENPICEWIVSVGKHEGVISGSTWVRVQELLDRNRSGTYRRPRSNTALLSGILRCGNCGSFMRPKVSDRIHASGELRFIYICTSKERSCGQLCSMKNADGNALDAQVLHVIRDIASPCADTAHRILLAKKHIAHSHSDAEEEQKMLKSQIAENEMQIKKQLLSLGSTAGTSAEKYLLEQIDELHKAGIRLKSRLAFAEESSRTAVSDEDAFRELCHQLAVPCGNIQEYTPEEKRGAVRTFIRSVYWDGETAHMYLHGAQAETEKAPLCEDRE